MPVGEKKAKQKKNAGLAKSGVRAGCCHHGIEFAVQQLCAQIEASELNVANLLDRVAKGVEVWS